MDTFRPLQGAEGLQIAEVTDDVVIGQDPSRPQYIPGSPGDLHSLSDVIHLDQRDLGMPCAILVKEPA